MRTPPFLRIGVPILVLIIAGAYFATHPWIFHRGERSDLWDGPIASVSVGHLMDELDLTDAQKQQIAELRQSLTDRRKRREAVLNVLTPEQRTRLKELRGESPSPNLTSKLPAANGT